MNFTTKRLSATVTAVLVSGTQIGTITKSTEERERPIKGTTLRYGRNSIVTVYRVRLDRSPFVDAPLWITSDAYGMRTLRAAKAEVANRLAGLVLKG